MHYLQRQQHQEDQQLCSSFLLEHFLAEKTLFYSVPSFAWYFKLMLTLDKEGDIIHFSYRVPFPIRGY